MPMSSTGVLSRWDRLAVGVLSTWDRHAVGVMPMSSTGVLSRWSYSHLSMLKKRHLGHGTDMLLGVLGQTPRARHVGTIENLTCYENVHRAIKVEKIRCTPCHIARVYALNSLCEHNLKVLPYYCTLFNSG